MFWLCVASSSINQEYLWETVENYTVFLKQASVGLSTVDESVPSKKVKKEPDGQI